MIPSMATLDFDSSVGSGEAANATVADVMLADPKTLSADATVGDLRRLFARPSVLTALLVDGAAFVGVVVRENLGDLADDAPARPLARSAGVTIGPEAPASEAMARMNGNGTWRLVVVGPDGVTLKGLVCLNSKRTGFC
jgi:CBS domain-containing protein